MHKGRADISPARFLRREEKASSSKRFALWAKP